MLCRGRSSGPSTSGAKSSATVPRTHVGFRSVDTAFRATGVIGGAIAMARDNRGGGYVLLIPNAIVLPFHVWALYATSRELKSPKRETSWERARRVQATGSGFRF